MPLDLPMCPHAKVWLKTVEILQADETLARAVQTWIIPDGSKDVAEMSSAMPLVRLEPNTGPAVFFDPASFTSVLTINVRTAIQSRDACDRLNLWAALVNALYPFDEPDRQMQIQQALRDAGAPMTGQYEFIVSATTPDPQMDADGVQVCDGQMRIEINWIVKP